MKYVICDRCKRVIRKDEKIGYISVNWRKEAGGDLMQPNPYEEYDFCETCIKQIVAVIDRIAVRGPVIKTPTLEDVEKVEMVLNELSPEKHDPDPEEAEVVEKIAQAPAPKRKPIDKGKVGALARAGWPLKKIADEMGVSTQRIGQILKEVQQND